jgi:LmbE family N-acetylglucosaminyl deacetylase
MPLFHPEHLQEGLDTHVVAEQYFFAKDPVHANTVVDITGYIDRKVEALCAHVSQMKLTLDDVRMSLEATGGLPEKSDMLDRENYRIAIQLMIKAYAHQVGQKAGYQYGEEFRCEKAGGTVVDAVRAFLKGGQI